MVYFISDLHLGIQERSLDKLREDLLLDFLKKIDGDCETLFILGDLFDFWFEYKQVVPKYFYRTLAALAELTKSGKKVEYLMGNHDFGHIDFFEKELNITVYKEDITREINGKKFYLSHGDGKSYKDRLYKLMKKILRSPINLRLYLALHPDFGIALASSSSKSSRAYTDTKDYGNIEGMEEFAKTIINEGFDYVIMGHRHKIIDIDFGKGRYINIGEWIDNPSFARFDGNDVQVLSVKDFLS